MHIRFRKTRLHSCSSQIRVTTYVRITSRHQMMRVGVASTADAIMNARTVGIKTVADCIMRNGGDRSQEWHVAPQAIPSRDVSGVYLSCLAAVKVFFGVMKIPYILKNEKK